MHICMICCKHDAVMRMRLLEVCFDCALDSIEPIEPGWGIALELKAEGYDYGDDSPLSDLEQLRIDGGGDNGAW